MTTLAAERRLLWRDAELRRGRWQTRLVDPASPPLRNLNTLSIGIVSLGHIGFEIARLARALGMAVSGVTRRPKPDDRRAEGLAYIGGLDELDRLCTESDVLVVTTPATPETIGLIGTRQLELLGARGILINVGRGPVVDEHALFQALQSGLLGFAAIDVWNAWASTEPHLPSQLPFHELPNIVMTPHYSGTAEDTYRLRAAEIARNIRAISDCRDLANVVRGTHP